VADIADVLARLTRTGEQLGIKRAAPPMTHPVAPPLVAVEVVAMPEPRRWLFKVGRDDLGRLATVVAEPIE